MESTESVLLAASAALGITLSDPVDLGGGSRTIVLRCHTAAGDTVVVKAYRDEPEALACFTGPDNNLLTTDGQRVLDFEGAGYHSVFLDGAYTRMLFATCWCVFCLPAQTATAVEQTYRAQITTGYPDLADDNLWCAGIRRAIAAWTLDVTIVLTPRAMTEAVRCIDDVGQCPASANSCATAGTLWPRNWRAPASFPLSPTSHED